MHLDVALSILKTEFQWGITLDISSDFRIKPSLYLQPCAKITQIAPLIDRPAVPPNREVQASQTQFLLVLLVAVSRATIGYWFKIIARVYDRPRSTSCGEVVLAVSMHRALK